MTTANGGDFARLSDLIARQRRELDRMQSAAAARSVADLARGRLMERLGCSAAEAQAQLAHLSAESGTSVLELAAQITGQVPLAGQSHITAQRQLTGQAAPTGADVRQVTLAGAALEVSAEGAGVAAAVLQEALAAADAVAVAVWLTEPDGGLVLASEAGFGAARGQPVAADTPRHALAGPAGGTR